MINKKIILFLLSLAFNQIIWGQNQYAQKKSPNIIFFLVDDLGWQDLSEPFWTQTTEANKKFKTPNVEKLAQQGVKFTNAYVNAICTPTRVSTLTGMNVANHKVTNWTMYKNQYTDAQDDTTLLPPKWNVNGLSPVSKIENTVYATPLPQLFKDAGYYTIMCGKAHFGAHETPGANPLNLGFVKNIGGSAAGNPSSFYGEQNYGNIAGKFNLRAVPGLEKYWGSDTFLSEALTLEALKAMDTATLQQKPFFLYFAHYAVHLPFDLDKRFAQNYQNQQLTAPELAYATLVEGFDKSLGDITNYLKKNNLDKNTIIVFLSDNGGFAKPPRQGEPNTQNYPLKNGKGSLYEGGIRTPLIVFNPFTKKLSNNIEAYVNVDDFYPTLLSLAGIKNFQTVQKLDGIDFSGYLKNKKSKNNRTLLWHFPNKWTGSSDGFDDTDFSWMSAIRKGDWKLIYYHKTGQTKLFNLRKDISETHDLSVVYKKKNKEMRHEMRKKLDENSAQMPVVIKTGKPVNYKKDLQ